MLRFDHDATSDVVYVEGYTDADYLDSPDEVQAYAASPLSSQADRERGNRRDEGSVLPSSAKFIRVHEEPA
jgi:hypothetical protein